MTLKLDPGTWRRLSELLDEALELPAPEIAAWLARLPPEHASLAPMLRELLARRDAPETADLIDRAPAFTLPQGARGAAADLGPGSTVGPYVLVKALGTGGMGVVWQAQRSDGLVKRLVALKVPHWLGARAALAERFARERDILASLEHPSIARLYDAGFAADGRPYIALEYVEGEAITAACDARALPLRERLELFVKVIAAVQYAHARLVLHRDLKPSNILVTAAGEPKLLDFGIAKLMADGAARETELTQAAGRALTPDYASPEQVTGAPVTTASDVYSLGMILYELLTGARPYRVQRASRAALEEAIIGADPVRPSAAVDDRKRSRELAGDLDAITLKALRKSPGERYATAEAFGDDLKRYLEGRPVVAQPERLWYRLRKFVARHCVATAAGGVVAAALGTGVAVALWQANEAREQAARSTALAEFIVGVFNQNSAAQPDPAAARKTSVRELLDLGKDRLLARKEANPAVTDGLLETFSELYFQLGLKTETVALDELRVRNAEAAFGANDLRTLAAQQSLASVYMSDARMDEARKLSERVLAGLDAKGVTRTAVRAKALGVLSQTYLATDPEKSYRYLREEVDILRVCCRSDHEYPLTLANLALAQALRGEIRAAGLSIDEAGRAHDALEGGGPKHSRAYIHGFAASILAQLDQPAEAEKAARAALATSKAASGDQSTWTYNEQNRMAMVMLANSKRDEARRLALDTLAAVDDKPSVTSHVPIRARALVVRSSALDRAARESAEALVPLLAASLDKPIDPFTRVEVLSALLEHALATGQWQRAAAMVPATRDLLASTLFAKSAGVASPMALCIRARVGAGQLAEARALLDAETRRLDALEVVPLAARVALGVAAAELLVREGREAEAKELVAKLRKTIAARPDRTYFADHDARLAAVIMTAR